MGRRAHMSAGTMCRFACVCSSSRRGNQEAGWPSGVRCLGSDVGPNHHDPRPSRWSREPCPGSRIYITSQAAPDMHMPCGATLSSPRPAPSACLWLVARGARGRDGQ